MIRAWENLLNVYTHNKGTDQTSMQSDMYRCCLDTCSIIWALLWENRLFAYAKTKTQISFALTAKLISAFVFATRIVQSLYYQNPKFQDSSPSSVTAQLGLCQTWSETPKTGFLTTRLIFVNCKEQARMCRTLLKILKTEFLTTRRLVYDPKDKYAGPKFLR